MRHIQIPLIISAVCFFVSCGNWLLPPMEVLDISYGSSISISFSAVPSETSIKQAFSLLENDATIQGEFYFSGKRFSFTPHNGIRPNCKYEVIISTAAEDTHYNSLLREYHHVFYTKADITLPEIVSISPGNESIMQDEPASIDIVFSKPVDPLSFTNAFRINPTVQYIAHWNAEGNTVSLKPEKPLGMGKRYTITISPSLKDRHNNALTNSFTSTFLYGCDTSAAQLSVFSDFNRIRTALVKDAITDHIALGSVILICFNEEVAVESISSSIDIIPGLAYSVEPDFRNRDSCRIIFSGKPEWNKTYTLTLRKGIQDISGNRIADDSVYHLLYNAEEERPLEFIAAFLKNGIRYEKISRDTNYASIIFDTLYFPPPPPDTPSEMYYVFKASASASSIDLVSAMKAVSISSTNGCIDIGIRTMSLLSNSDFEACGIYPLLGANLPEGNYFCLKLGVEIGNSIESGLINFSIQKDVKDNLGNTMLESRIITMNKL